MQTLPIKLRCSCRQDCRSWRSVNYQPFHRPAIACCNSQRDQHWAKMQTAQVMQLKEDCSCENGCNVKIDLGCFLTSFHLFWGRMR